jgi:hypothetical protein
MNQALISEEVQKRKITEERPRSPGKACLQGKEIQKDNRIQRPSV